MQKHTKNWLESRGYDGTEPYYECELCGSNDGCDVHHIESRKYKGTDEPFNLILLCRECHTESHANNTNETKEGLYSVVSIITK